METPRRKITAKAEPSSIRTLGSRPASRAASPLVTLIDTNEPTTPVRPKAKLTSTGGLKPTANAARKTPASSTVGRSPRDRPVSVVGNKPPFGRSATPSKPAVTARIASPEPSRARTTRNPPLAKNKPVPPKPPTTTRSTVRSPTRSPRFEAPSSPVHRRVASASASSSVVSGGEPRARNKLPSSLSSINLPVFPSAPASPSPAYPALPSSHTHSPDTDLSAPPSALPSELSPEEPKRAIVSAPVTPIHVQTRIAPPVPVRPRTSSVTIIADEPRVNDHDISTPPVVRIKAKLTPTTPPNHPAAKTIAHVRPDQLVVPRQRSGSISAGSSFSGLATSTLSRVSSVRVTSASRILSPPLLRPGPALGLMVPPCGIFVPPGIRSPPTSILSTSSRTTSTGSESSAPPTSIDRARTPIECGPTAPLKPGHMASEEEGIDRDDSGIDMFEAGDQREEARSNRKMADLEISNKSLLAINATLEATKSKQAKEIRDLKRRLRESRLVLPHSAYLALEQKDPLETKGGFEDEEEDGSDNDATQTRADETFDRVRSMLERLTHDAHEALKSMPVIPETKDEAEKKPIRVLDGSELREYADPDLGADPDPETETESETDFESIDEDSPSAAAEKAALATPKHRSSFSVGVGLFTGWKTR